MEDLIDYRIVDYQKTIENDKGESEKVWMNTDPKGSVTTDGSRMGQGDPDPTTEDIENSDWVNVGFQDKEGEWHYYWLKGPFDEEFWISDSIEQVTGEYGIVLGESL